MSNTTDEELREQIDDIFFKQYNALHDNFFHSEFEAAKAATVDVLALIHRTQLEAAEKTMDFLGDYKDWGMVKREVLLAELQAALEKQA